jgi:flagellar motor switch protein FliG
MGGEQVMTKGKLSSAEKAAILLLSLGEDLAGQILGQMNPGEVNRIAAAMSQLGRVDEQIVQMVSGEFHNSLVSYRQQLSGTPAATKRILQLAGRSSEAEAVQSEASVASQELADLVDQMTPESLAKWLQAEAPQTSAVVLAHSAPQQAAKAVSLLPKALQVEAVHRLAKIGDIDLESLRAIVEVLKETRSRSQGAAHTVGGAGKLVSLLNAMPQAEGEKLLAEIEGRDPALAAELRKMLFTFADLTRLSDRDMQTLLAQVPAITLRLALKGAEASVSLHIYKNLSERAAKLLRDDVDALPKTRLQEVQAAQQQLADLAQALAAQGKITIMSKDEVYV